MSPTVRRLHTKRLTAVIALIVSGVAIAIPPTVLPDGAHADSAAAKSQWQKVMSTSFNTKAAAGKVDEVYADKVVVYDDSDEYKQANLSVHDGKLDVNLHGKNGVAFFFRPTATTRGMTYGRYVYKFKVTKAANQRAAFLLWPNSGVWSDGEVDFPEGSFENPLHGYHHTTNPDQCATPPGCNEAIHIEASGSWRKAHTAEMRWTPRSISYYVDGKRVKTVDRLLPVGDHRLTFQSVPGPKAKPGHLYIYSVIEYRWVG